MKIFEYFLVTVAPAVVKRDDDIYDLGEDYDPYGIPNESELSSKTPEKCERVCETVCFPTTTSTFITPKPNDESGKYFFTVKCINFRLLNLVLNFKNSSFEGKPMVNQN